MVLALAGAFAMAVGESLALAQPDPVPFGARPLQDTNRYALGSYTINVVFIEDIANRWADAGRTIAYHQDQMRQAADWWEDQTDGLHPNARLSIGLNFVNSAVPLEVTDIGSNGFTTVFVDDLFDALGYSDVPVQLDKARHFAEDQRQAHGTHWSFTQVVKPIDGRAHPFAINGPLVVDFMYDFRNVYMHEWGHMFGAPDEYPPNRTSTRTGYLHYENGNAFYLEDFTPNPDAVSKSLMRNNWPAINDFTRGQVGIIDSDSDTIPDILDTFPTLVGDTSGSRGAIGRFVFDGQADVTALPYPGPHGLPDITINTIAGAEYSLNGQPWAVLAAADGMFDGYTEQLRLELTGLDIGDHLIALRAINSVGNFSDPVESSFLATAVPAPGSVGGVLGLAALIAGRRRCCRHWH